MNRRLTVAHLGALNAQPSPPPLFAGLVANLLADLRRVRPDLILMPGRLHFGQRPQREARLFVYDLVEALGHLAPTVVLAPTEDEAAEWGILERLRTANPVYLVPSSAWLDLGTPGHPLGISCLEPHPEEEAQTRAAGGLVLGMVRDLPEDCAENWGALDYTASCEVPEWADDRVIPLHLDGLCFTHREGHLFHVPPVGRSGALITTLERGPMGTASAFSCLPPKVTT